MPAHDPTTEADRGSDSVASTPAVLSPEEFASRFEESFRVFWLIAAGILRDRTLAEDAVQEAAMVALGKLDQYQPGTNFNAWMGQMVRFTALNHRRREKVRSAIPTDPELIEEGFGSVRGETVGETAVGTTLTTGPGSSLPALPEGQEAFDDDVLAALDTLNETARACLLLRTVEGMDYRQIARVLDLPENTAMSHVHRARQALRERLSDRNPARAKADQNHPEGNSTA